MGFAGISVPQLAIIMVIVLLLFGSKRIAQLGGDLGAMIKGFKKEVSNDDLEGFGGDMIETAKTANKVRKVAKKFRSSL